MKKYKYDIVKYPFKQLIQEALRVDELDLLHSDSPVFSREKDQSTVLHQRFYELARTDEFQYIYRLFLKMEIKPLYSENIVYQAIPTFRVSFPNNIAVGEFHKDKDYRDKNWAEAVMEDNFYLPLTDAYDTNTIWVESYEDSGKYSPMNCNNGEFIQWDGSNLKHGNKINLTGFSRVSFDFRVMPKSSYLPSKKASINTHTEFKLGGYYSEL